MLNSKVTENHKINQSNMRKYLILGWILDKDTEFSWNEPISIFVPDAC
jgi:hypothetical protein